MAREKVTDNVDHWALCSKTNDVLAVNFLALSVNRDSELHRRLKEEGIRLTLSAAPESTGCLKDFARLTVFFGNVWCLTSSVSQSGS